MFLARNHAGYPLYPTGRESLSVATTTPFESHGSRNVDPLSEITAPIGAIGATDVPCTDRIAREPPGSQRDHSLRKFFGIAAQHGFTMRNTIASVSKSLPTLPSSNSPSRERAAGQTGEVFGYLGGNFTIVLVTFSQRLELANRFVFGQSRGTYHEVFREIFFV